MRKTIRIYDNGGLTADRYTAVDMLTPHFNAHSGVQTYDAIAFSGKPFHPQGFGQHTSAMPGAHLGRRITLDDLPADARKFVEQFAAEGE